MADPAPVDQSYKLAALQALATGGSQAKAAVDQARSAMQASQGDALKQAASNSAAYGLGQAGTDALSKPISGAYGNRLSTLDQITAPRLSAFTALQAPTAQVFDTKSAAIAAKQAGSGGGGGGGGGSGGSSTKVDKWFTPDLQNQYDTKENLYAAINQQASSTKTGKPAYQNAIDLANQYGVPQGAATAQFKPSTTFNQWAGGVQAAVKKNVTMNKVQQELRSSGMSQADRDYFYNVYQQALQNAPKKKK